MLNFLNCFFLIIILSPINNSCWALSNITNNLISEEKSIMSLKEKKVFENVIKIFNLHYNNILSKNSFSIKSDGSIVSHLEKNIEKEIGTYLSKVTSWASFQGEEGYNYKAQGDLKWFLDPIDGTISFKNGLDTFGMTLSLVNGYDVLATLIHFPKINQTFVVFKGEGVKINGKTLHYNKSSNDSHIVIAHSDLYTFKLSEREEILTYLQKSEFIPRTYTDIYGYSLVAQGKCALKVDAAAALWDLYPGFLLARESGAKTVFIPAKKPTEDLYGSLIFGDEKLVDKIINDLIKLKIIDKDQIYVNHIPDLL